MTSMAPRPQTRDTNRPATREQTVDNNMIPSRTSSLHSRITQPLPSTLAKSNNRPTPKTLTHAYMVCGVGREPSQWVKAPPPSHGKIQHMKGAVGQFWLPEILGSSPRLETDNEIARALHSAMRVGAAAKGCPTGMTDNYYRRAFLMMSKSAPAGANRTASTTRSSCSKIPSTLCMVSLSECGPEQMRSEPRQFVTFAAKRRPTTETSQMRHIGFPTA
jgi:hypothetical protein